MADGFSADGLSSGPGQAALSAGAFYGAFTEEAARLGLDARQLLPPSRVTLYGELDSTNSELLRRLEDGGPLLDREGRRTERGRGLDFTLVASAAQSAGRGRIGRRFWSPPQGGIYFSFIYSPEGGIADPGRCTATAAVAVCRALDGLFGVSCGIKWVNDVYLGGRKVCGILTEGWMPAPQEGESPRIQAAVVGIGINLRTGAGLPEELSRKVGGVADMAVRLGCPPARAASVTRELILASCMAHAVRLFTGGEDLLDEYASRSILTGREVSVIPLVGDERGRYRATVCGIGADFSLRVRTAEGQERELHGGEVSLDLGLSGE